MTNLTKATDTSYRVANPTSLANVLLAAGYQREPVGHPAIIAKLRNSRSGNLSEISDKVGHPAIIAKLRKRGSVIVVYGSGAVVLGGVDLQAGHIALKKVEEWL